MDKPEYIPIPRSGTKCTYCGLSRSSIYNLISPTKANGYKAVVLSTKVALPGRKRGCRRVHYPSLMRYLDSQTVPVEKLALRRAWAEFRSQSRRGKSKPTPSALDTTTLDFLPDAAEVFETKRQGQQPHQPCLN